MPQAALENGLAQLDSHGYADVAAAIARLRVVAAHRDQFPKLSEKLKFDRYIVDSLKDILTKPPREVLSLKEHELADLASGGNRKRGRRFVKMVKRDMPAIYDLEADWLDSIGRQKAQGTVFVASRGAVPTVAGSSTGRNYWWVVGILVFGAIRGMLMVADSDHRGTNHYQPSYPSPNNWQPPSWQPNRARSPSYMPESNSSGSQRPGETRPVPSLGIDKDIWKPYPTSDQKDVWKPYQTSERSEDRNQTSPRSRQALDELLKPQSPNPSAPKNSQDDRYSR
jgi:hypothetical protein